MEDIGEEEEPQEEEDADMIGEEDEMADFIVDEDDEEMEVDEETGEVIRYLYMSTLSHISLKVIYC